MIIISSFLFSENTHSTAILSSVRFFQLGSSLRPDNNIIDEKRSTEKIVNVQYYTLNCSMGLGEIVVSENEHPFKSESILPPGGQWELSQECG